MELLSYPSISADEEVKIHQFLAQITIVNVDESVKSHAISLRRKYRLKLPDTIICGTALVVNAILLSNDSQLATLTEIRVNSVNIR